MGRTLLIKRGVLEQIIIREVILFLLPVVSALLMTASFPPFDLGILAWFGLSPLLFVLRRRGSGAAAGLAFLYGGIFGMGAFCWINCITTISFSNFLLWLIVFSLYFLLFGFLYRLISMGIGSWIIVGAPALWVVLEYTRANLFFLSWPWNLLGHSQYRYLPVIQIADIAGVYGISFLIVMVNQLLSQVPELFAGRGVASSSSTTGCTSRINWTVHILTVAVILVFTFSYGWHRLATIEDGKHLRVALVQANALTRYKMSLADQMEHLRVYERLTIEAAKRDPDLIVWPASSLPAPIRSSRLVRHTISRLAQETGSYLLVGGAGHEKLESRKEGYQTYSNSEFLISPSGRLVRQYNKIRLLPFNEYLPLQGKITWPKWISTLKENFMPGEEYTLFQVSGARFGTPICWENIFPDFFRRFIKDGGNFMVSVTNEGFFGNTAGPYQTLAINAFRAVENRVAIARSAPTGVSAFINPDGEIIEKVRDSRGKDLFVSGSLVRDVPLSDKRTIYTVYGDIFTYAVICLAALIILGSLFARKRFLFRQRSYDDL